MNPFAMMKDAKNMEKMLKPALEKFMKESGFVKEDEIEPLKKRITATERRPRSLRLTRRVWSASF